MSHPQRPGFNLAAAVRLRACGEAVEITFGELVRAYCATCMDESDLRLRKWVEAFGQQSAWAISSDQLEVAGEAMREHGYKNSTVNRDIATVASVYRWAKARRLPPPGFASPTRGVPRWEEQIRRIHVAAADLERLRTASLSFSDRRFGVFVALLIDTGARKSELLQRRWDEVDLPGRQILAPQTKNGTPRTLFFAERTQLLMERVYPKRHANSLLFEGRVPGESIDYKRSWASLCSQLGLRELHMHDMRHAAAANLLKAGVTLAVAAQVLGHDPAVLARRYGHLETAALRRAQEAAWMVQETS